MPASTDILQFAGGGGANVVTQAQYAALTTLLANGFSAGTALSPELNKVWRQSTFMACGLANFMVNRGINVPDDGNLTNLIAEIEAALHAYLDKSVAGNTDVVLSPTLEANYPIIDLTGLLTGNINVIVPTAAGHWIINNSTTGAFNITVKTAAGTGVIVTQGKANVLFCDGVNVLSGIDSLGAASSSPVSVVNGKMTLVAASATGNFTADEVTVETALGNVSYKIGSYAQAINLAVVGAGGMDVGAAPVSGYVALYAIAKTGGTLPSILACNVTTSSGEIYAGANMPAGYTLSKLLAIVPTNGASQMVAGQVRDRMFSFTAYPTIFTGHAAFAVVTSQSISVGAPPSAIFASFVFGSTQASVGGFGVGIAGDASGTGGDSVVVYQLGAVQSMLGGMASMAAAQHFKDVELLTAQTIYLLGGANASVNNLYLTNYTW